MLTVSTGGETVSIPDPIVGGGPIPGFGRLVWHDEFDGTAVDTSKWRVDNGVAANNERAIRWARNVTVSGGCLVIQPKLEISSVVKSGQLVTRQYTSGSVDTGTLFLAQRPFYVEWRNFLPLSTGHAAGMWPADWLRAAAGSGEIDACEFFELGPDATPGAINEAPHGKQTAHIYSDTNTGAGKAGILAPAPLDVAAWHVFGCQVDADGSVTIYRDGAVFKRFPVATYPYLGGAAFAGGYRILITLQIGSNYYGGPDLNTDWSQAFRTDYVRVWTP